MRWFKNRKINLDERIEETKNKIYKEACFIAVAICFISIIIKFFLYGSNFHNIVTELIIILATSIYTIIKQAYLGIYSDDEEIYDKNHKIPMSTMNVIIGAVLGIAISVFWGMRSAIVYGNESNRIKYFIITFVASFGIYGCFFMLLMVGSHATAKSISKKQAKKMSISRKK